MDNARLQLHHVSMIVEDTAKALDFYCGLLGLELDESRPDLGYPGAWLRLGSHQIHLLELPNPDPVDARPQHGGRDRHVAMATVDFDAIVTRLQDKGVACTFSRSGRQAAFFRDVDGNAIELIGVS